MLMMRLQRTGRKNNPSYRVVVTDKRNGPRAGNHVDTIGSYNPKAGDFQIDAEKAKHWLSKGVQPSDTLYNFLVTKGIVEGKKRNVLPKKSPIVSETPEAEKKEEAPAEAEEASEEAKEEAPAEEAVGEKAEEAAPVAEEEKTEEAPKEEKKEEPATEAEEVTEEKEETPAETKEEPAEEEKKEDAGEEKEEEEKKEETTEEETKN